MDATLRNNIFLRDQNIQHLNVQTGRSGHLRFANILGLDRTARVVVVTDVIGTSHTLESTLAIILHAHILKVLTIVNASTQWNKTVELKGQEIPIDYIVRRKLSYFNHLPRGWSYGEICQVDPDTHVLVKAAASTEGALWKDKERVAVERTSQEDADYPLNRFLTDVVFPASAFSVGHFVSARKHILYLFDVHRIAEHSSDEIVRTIENDVKRVIESRKADSSVAHIVYRDVNPGLELIAGKSCGRFPGATLTSISDDEFRSRFDQETTLWSDGIVVLLDDAADSGDTLFRLLDIAERAGATCVLGYVLIKRGTQYVARRLEKTRQYGRTEVQIRFLAEAEIPSYSDDNCPVCQEIRELSDLLRQFSSTPRLSQALRSKIDQLRVTPVSIITHEQTTRLPEQYTTLEQYKLLYRWHLEMAKEDPAARHSLAKVVREHQDERQKTVAFFSLLAAERIPSRLEHPWFTTIFYATFQEEIVRACRDLIACHNELSEDALAATLYVSEVFDTDSAMTNCATLLEHLPVHSRYFLEVVIHSLHSKVLNDYPAILKSLFQELRLRAPENADVDSSRLFHDLAQFWAKKESNVDTDMRKRLKCYQELRGGRFHEIGHLRDSIVFCSETDPTDFDGLLRDWNVLRDEVGDIVGFVRECIATHVTSSTALALEGIIHRITLQLTDGNAIAEPAESDSGKHLGASERERIAIAIAQSAQRIHDLIHADGGLRMLLDRFQANIKSITYQILQQHERDLQAAGIKVERRFPEEACIVFAEDPSLKLAIHNIIENVWKSSEARQLEIGADIKPDQEYIEITFADDGKGFNGKTGTGLKNVERIVRSYGGSFSIRQIDDAADPFFSRGFRTVASITLPFLP
jgi:adenine/guanine phosphoribosyltransferase-like PRPP-binding protein